MSMRLLSGKHCLWMIAGIVALLIPAASVQAAVYYWDTNGTGTGATNGTTAPGMWGTDAFWSTSSVGAILPTVVNTTTNDDLYFSAGYNATGNYTVTLNGTQSAHSIRFDEGTVTISGGTSLVLGGETPTITTVWGAPAIIKSVIDGTAGVTKAGVDTLVFAGTNTYTGGTTVSEGTLSLDFSVSGAPLNNIINSVNGLTLAGGTLNVAGKASTTNNQQFNGLTLTANSASTITATAGTSGAVNVTLGAITRNSGSTMAFAIPANGSIATTSGTANSLLVDGKGVAYATVGTSDWAAKDGSNANIVAGSSLSGFYTSNNTTTLSGNADMASGVDTSLAQDTSILSLRFSSGARSVAIGSGKTLTTGGILMGASAAGSSITGGTLRSASTSGGDLLVFQNSSSYTMTIGSSIADNTVATGMTKAGSGVLVLAGNNTYTGTTAINGGRLIVTGDNTSSATNIVSARSTLQVGNDTTTGEVGNAITNNGTVVFFRSDDLTYGGTISGDGDVYKYGDGTLTFSSSTALSYTGFTSVRSGQLLLDFGNMTTPTHLLNPATETTLNSATLGIKGKNGAFTTSQSLSLTVYSGDSHLVVDSNGGIATNVVLSAVTRNTGGILDVVLPAHGNITTSESNTNGILGGWATVGGTDWAANSAGTGTGNVIPLPATGYATLSDSNPRIPNTSTANVRINNTSSGNTAAGSATINSLLLGDATARTVTIGTGNTLRLSSGGVLIPAGAGAMTLGAAGNAGTLTAGSVSGTSGELIVIQNSANTATINAAITNNGTGVVTFTKSGSGTLILTGTHTYTGGTYINNGRVELGVGAAISNTGTVYVDGASSSPATLSVTGGSVTSSSLWLGETGSGTLAVQNGGQFASTSGNLGYIQGSAGTVTVAGAGSKWINSGGLAVGGSGTGTLTVQNGGRVSNTAVSVGQWSGSTGTVTVSGSGSTWTSSQGLRVGSQGKGTLSITGGGAVSNTYSYVGYSSGSTGTVTVSGSGSTWTNSGGLCIGGNESAVGGTGSVTASSGGVVSVSGTLKVWSTGTLTVDGGAVTAGTLTGTGSVKITDSMSGPALTVGSADNSTFSGNISDYNSAGSVRKVGSSSLTLAGSNSYSGETIISEGNIVLGSNSALQNHSVVTVSSTATRGLDLAGFDATVGALWGAGTVGSTSGTPTLTVQSDNAANTFGGFITDAIHLTKVGTGKWTLTGNNTYSGGTTVAAGTLGGRQQYGLGDGDGVCRRWGDAEDRRWGHDQQ